MDNMTKQTKTHEFKTRLAGTKHEYHALKLILDGKVVGIHTSKSLNHINRLRTDWK
jgi:hypothetical protein